MVNYTADFLSLTPTSRHLMFSYNLLLVTVGIPGNLLLFYSSNVHKALNVELVTRLAIEHIAVSDVMILLVNFLPTLTTVFHHGWVLGEELCYLVSFSSSIFFFYEILLTVLLSARRLGLVSKFAKRDGLMSYRVTLVVLTVLFLVSAAPSLTYMSLGSTAFFAPQTLMCISSNYRDYPLASLVVVGVYLIAPAGFLVLINLGILAVLCKATQNNVASGEGFSRTIISILVVSWVFILSYIPIFIKMALNMSGTPVSYTFQITQQYLLSANVLLNPPIYFIFNRRFRRFVKELCGRPVTFISRTFSLSNQ